MRAFLWTSYPRGKCNIVLKASQNKRLRYTSLIRRSNCCAHNAQLARKRGTCLVHNVFCLEFGLVIYGKWEEWFFLTWWPVLVCIVYVSPTCRVPGNDLTVESHPRKHIGGIFPALILSCVYRCLTWLDVYLQDTTVLALSRRYNLYTARPGPPIIAS